MSKITINLSDLLNNYGDYDFKKQKIFFKSKNYEKDNKWIKFNGSLEFIYDNSNKLIYSIKWNFQELTIDKMTTLSWFNNLTPNFINREIFFKKLNIKQIPRLMQTEKLLYKLNNEEIQIFNDYLNFEYSGSIKNIIGIIKGNNPSGAVSSPENEEMIRSDSKNSNFLLFFKSRKVKENLDEKNYKIIKNLVFDTAEKSDNYFHSLKGNLKNLYINLNNYSNKSQDLINKNKLSYEIYSAQAKKDFKKIFEDDTLLFNFLKKEIVKLRSKYQNLINKYGLVTFSNIRQTQIQKAHIYQVKWIKEDIYKFWKNDKRYNKNIEDNKYLIHLNKISDPENYLSLEEEIHRMFDKNWITYNDKGALKHYNNKEVLEYLKYPESKKYLQIKLNYLTLKKIDYIKARNIKIKKIKNA